MKHPLNRIRKFKLPIGLWQLNLLMSLLFISVFNLYFWKELIVIIKPSSGEDYLFVLSIFFLLVLTVNLILNLFTSQKTYKAIYALIFILSAISFYYISQYNIVIDKEMIRNVMESNSSEVKDLIGFNFFMYLAVLAFIPVFFILKTTVTKQGIWRQIFTKLKMTGFSILAIGLTLYVSYPSYASLARGHRHLSHLILPTNFIFASISYVSEQFKSANIPFNDVSKDAIQHYSLSKKVKKVTVLIVGETARADRFSINGYGKETNPYLKQRNIVNFKQTNSCGTSTAVSLPCLFSYLSRKSYSHKVAKNSSNLLDFFTQVGIDVQWRDNNTGCKGICNRTDYLDFTQAEDETLCSEGECYDEILLKGLSKQINANANDQVIILHQKGSHGPAYYLRYPPKFEVFKPTCQSVELQKCSQIELDNSYDDTILYTDYFINQTMNLLEKLPDGTQASLLYISDHGESLGENNLYLHGTPYLMAPESQTHVPFFYWTPAKTKVTPYVNLACLRDKQNYPVSHDNLFHSMLGYMGISTTLYQEKLDLFSSCKSKGINNLAAEFNEDIKP